MSNPEMTPLDLADELNNYIQEWSIYEEIVAEERAKKAKSTGADHEFNEAHNRTKWTYGFDEWQETEESIRQREEG